MFWIPNKCCATVIDRSASTARPPATMTGKMVVVDATRFPEPSRMMSPGKTSSPKSLATAFGISAGRPRIVAVDHEGLERDGLGKRLSRRRLIERGLSAEGIAIELTHDLAPS